MDIFTQKITTGHFQDFQSNIIQHLDCAANVLRFLVEIGYPYATDTLELFQLEIQKITFLENEDLNLNTPEMQKIEETLKELQEKTEQDKITKTCIIELNAQREAEIQSVKCVKILT